MPERWEKWREDLHKENPDINPEYVNREGVWHHDFYRDRPTAIDGGELSYPSQDYRPSPTGTIGGFNKADLLRRGWTRTAIRRILGEPDSLIVRQGLTGPLRIDRPECVYGRERVFQAEEKCKIRFRRATEKLPPDESEFTGTPEAIAVIERADTLGSSTPPLRKLGARQRAIVALLNKIGGGPMNLTDITAEIWKVPCQLEVKRSVPRSFYESTRRAACALAARGILDSGDTEYRREFWICGCPGMPQNTAWRSMNRRTQLAGYVVKSEILCLLSDSGPKRYCDVVRILSRHRGADMSVPVCRAVKRLHRQGRIQRIVRSTPAGKTYELLSL
jgi:hypothetical protein